MRGTATALWALALLGLAAACAEDTETQTPTDVTQQAPDSSAPVDAAQAPDTQQPQHDAPKLPDAGPPPQDIAAAPDVLQADTVTPPPTPDLPPGEDIVTGPAPIPTWTLSVVARTSYDQGNFAVPAGLSLAAEQPAVNHSRQVAVGLKGDIDAPEQMWVDGQVVYTSPPGALLRDPSLGNDGKAAFAQTLSSANGIYVQSALATNGPPGATSFDGVTVGANGALAYRAKIGSGAAHVIWSNGQHTLVAQETGLDAASDIAFLFTPAFNTAGQLASKARYGATGNDAPDRIIRWYPSGAAVTIAEDANANPGSSWAGFDNGVGLAANGHVAYTGDRVDGSRAIVLSDGATAVTIATQGQNGVAEIEFFRPAANADGLVAFRAKNAQGKRAVYVGNGQSLTPAVSDGTTLTTDLGPGRVGEANPGNPVFGGNVGLNARGDMVIRAGLQSADGATDWGTAVLLLTADVP